MRSTEVNFIFKEFLDLEANVKEHCANEIKSFLEFLKDEENHFTIDNNKLSPEVYIEVGDFLEKEEIKKIIILLSDLYTQVGNEYKAKLDKELVLEKTESQLNFISSKFQQNPSNNQHKKLMLEKIALKIQQKAISTVNSTNFEPHTIIFVSTNTFNFLTEDYAKKNYYNNQTHAKNPKYPSREEILNEWNLKKIGLVQFVSKVELQKEYSLTNENSRGVIITDCLNWNKGNSKLINLKKENDDYVLKQIKNFCFIKKDSPKINQNFLQIAKDRNDGVFNSIINIQCKAQKATLNSSIKRNNKLKEFIRKRNPGKGNYVNNVLLSNNTINSASPTIFFMDGNPTIWNEFYQKCIDCEIPYLVSIQFRNLLNSCFTQRIGNEIVDMFSSNNSTIKLADSFFQQWRRLTEEEKEEVIACIKVLINDIIEIHQNVDYDFENYSRVILPRLVKDCVIIKDETSQFLKIRKNQIIDWNNDYSRGSIVSFDYRDLGSPYYPIKPPSIFEPNHLKLEKVYLVSYLFENKFYYGQYNYNKLIVEELDNNYRRSKHDWGELIDKVNEMKPDSIDKTDYEFEETIQREIDIDQFEIKFEVNGKDIKRIFNEYSKFILKDSRGFELEDIDGISNIGNLKVVPLDELLNDLEFPEYNLKNEEVINKSNELRKKYLREDQFYIESRVWKILLKEKALQVGEENLYDLLRERCKTNGFEMVSFNTFQNAWINYDSDSNRTSYKHLKILCDYLHLGKDYLSFLQLYCKTEANKTRQSTVFHTELITDLILPHIEKEENEEFNNLFFPITESQKDSLMLMGIAENEIQNKLTEYLNKTKNIIVEKNKKIKSITKL